MKLLKVLGKVNQIEKISFLKILDGLCVECRKMSPKVNDILLQGENQLKNVDNENVVNLFNLLKDKYIVELNNRLDYSDCQLDLVVEVIIRDGNTIMSREWFSKLYSNEISKLRSKTKTFSAELQKEKSNLDPYRKRDYLIYQSCLERAYKNDIERGREVNLSWEEKTILHTLSKSLELSIEEVREIHYTVVPLEKHSIEDLLSELKDSGLIFFSRKTQTIYVPEEIVWLLREILGIEIPNKYLRRILRHLKNSEINQVSNKHNIDRKLKRNEKIQEILKQGIDTTNLLSKDIFKDNATKADKAKRIHTLITKELELELQKTGRSLDERITLIIQHYKDFEGEDSKSLSRDGFRKLLTQLVEFSPKLNDMVRKEFELQDEDVMNPEFLVDYNLGPRDIIYLLTKDNLREFCKKNGISSRGNLVLNIINQYRDIQDLYIENFSLIGRREINALNEMGLSVKESELGLLYEKTTKEIFTKLGFHVDEKLKKKLNTPRSKMDILLNLGGKGVMIVECKTIKDKDYNKYTAVSRQLTSYKKQCQISDYNVPQVLIVSNDFSEDFISECEYDYELNISLVTSDGLVKILEGFKESHMKEFPVRLLMKDGLLNEDRIVKVLGG